MLVSMNIQNNRQNYKALQNNNLQCSKPKPQSFTSAATTATASAGVIVDTMKSKSKFFEPFEKVWDGMTDWLAKNFVARCMNTDIVGKFANKFEKSKLITNHILTIGAATGTGMYMYKTSKLPEEQMNEDRKKVLMLNQALTFGVSTAGAYGLDGALIGKWKKATNRFAQLYTGDKDIVKKIDDMNKELKAQGKNKIDLIDYAEDVLHDKKFVNRLKGMDIAKKLLIFTLIYRYLVPVAVTPVANKLGDKYLAYKKQKEAELNAK